MRFRVTQTITTEYEVEPAFYLPTTDPQEMLEIDLAAAQEDPGLFLAGDTEITVTGEILEDEDNG